MKITTLSYIHEMLLENTAKAQAVYRRALAKERAGAENGEPDDKCLQEYIEQAQGEYYKAKNSLDDFEATDWN